jgi:hypothetical protein
MKPAILSLLLACAAPAAAQPRPSAPSLAPSAVADRAEILAAIDGFFAAVHDKDKARMSAAVLPEGLATAIRLDGQQPFMRSWHWATYIENQLGGQQRFTERLFDPQVKVERDIAMVWASYDLIVDDKFDHCGVDHFDLVRKDGRWLVYNLTWTNQTAACPRR